MDPSKDYYKILGVSSAATKDEITRAYRKLAVKCHPDKVTNPSLKAQRTKEFLNINDAKDVLLDDAERAKYDLARRWGTRRRPAEPLFDPNFSFARSARGDYHTAERSPTDRAPDHTYESRQPRGGPASGSYNVRYASPGWSHSGLRAEEPGAHSHGHPPRQEEPHTYHRDAGPHYNVRYVTPESARSAYTGPSYNQSAGYAGYAASGGYDTRNIPIVTPGGGRSHARAEPERHSPHVGGGRDTRDIPVVTPGGGRAHDQSEPRTADWEISTYPDPAKRKTTIKCRSRAGFEVRLRAPDALRLDKHCVRVAFAKDNSGKVAVELKVGNRRMIKPSRARTEKKYGHRGRLEQVYVTDRETRAEILKVGLTPGAKGFDVEFDDKEGEIFMVIQTR